MIDKIRIFVDMDGTLARFHDENLYLERMFEKGFFRDLKPFENAVSAIKELVKDNISEIFILSATVNSCSLEEKQEWLDRYLPEIDKEHRIFTSLNVPKSEAIAHRLTDKDILIDDYNKNLLEWQKAGGTSVKAKNNINHKGLHGELWKGDLIDITDTAESIVERMTKIIVSREKGIEEEQEMKNLEHSEDEIEL